MITAVVSGYAVLMLTIVLALLSAARRPEPKPSDVAVEELPVRRAPRPVQPPPARATVHGGTEVLAIGA